MVIRRVAGALIGVVLVAGCGAAPMPTAPSIGTAAASAPATARASSTPSTVPAPFSLARVPDRPALMGDAVGRPSVVVLPDGSYLMLRNEDMPDGGELLRSADGRDWSPVKRTDIGLDAPWLGGIVQSGTTIAALGTAEERTGNGDTDPDLAVWISADGRGWTRLVGQDAVAIARFKPAVLVGSPAGFAARTYDGTPTLLLAGPDGRGWHRSVIPAPAAAGWSPEALAPFRGGWIVIGGAADGSAAWRWDGATWGRLPFEPQATVVEVAVAGERIILTGYLEIPDPVDPDAEPAAKAVAWESADGGATWADPGVALGAFGATAIFPAAGGLLAVTEPPDSTAPTTVLWSAAPGQWSPVEFEEGGSGFDRPYVALVVEAGNHLVLAGNTVGTGAGGDRVVVWTGEIAGR